MSKRINLVPFLANLYGKRLDIKKCKPVIMINIVPFDELVLAHTKIKTSSGVSKDTLACLESEP